MGNLALINQTKDQPLNLREHGCVGAKKIISDKFKACGATAAEDECFLLKYKIEDLIRRDVIETLISK